MVFHWCGFSEVEEANINGSRGHPKFAVKDVFYPAPHLYSAFPVFIRPAMKFPSLLIFLSIEWLRYSKDCIAHCTARGCFSCHIFFVMDLSRGSTPIIHGINSNILSNFSE